MQPPITIASGVTTSPFLVSPDGWVIIEAGSTSVTVQYTTGTTVDIANGSASYVTVGTFTGFTAIRADEELTEVYVKLTTSGGSATYHVEGQLSRDDRMTLRGYKRMSMNGLNPTYSLDSNGNVQGLVGPSGGFAGYIDAGFFGASPSASAAVNTAAIQAALNKAGTVTLLQAGTYQILPPLIIGSNTNLVLGKNVTIQGVGGNALNMLQSAAYTRSRTSVTIAWISGRVASVGWNGHGRSKGDFVWINGGTTTLANSAFIGVFRVVAVTDANNFTIKLVRTPTAAPGTGWTACVADKNISLEGGTWDCNSTVNFVVPGSTAIGAQASSHNLLFSGCANLVLTNVTANDSIKYAFAFGAINGLTCKNLRTEYTNADCVKMYGPMTNVVIDGISAKTGDDTVTVQSKEAVAYQQFAWTYGDIIQVSVKNVQSDSLHNVCGIFPSDTEYVDQIIYENISGIGVDSGISINSGQSIGYCGNITLRNFNAIGNNAIGVSCNVCNIASLNIDGYQVVSDGISNTNAVRFSSLSSVRLFNVKGMVYDLNTGIASTSTAITNNGAVDVINVSDSRIVSYTGNSVQGVTLNSGATTTEVNFTGVQFISGASNACSPAVVASGAVGTPKITFKGCQISGTSNGLGVNVGSSCDVSISDSYLNSISNGFLFCTAGTPIVSLKASGNTFGSGSWVNVIGGTPVISVFGWDIKVAPNATGIARTAGSFCFNNGAAVGTLVQNNLVVCDATNAANSWKQLTNTTLSF